MYSTFERAHLFMLKAYKGKKFKYTNIEKSFHAVSVALMIRETTTIDDYIIAALLHNIITDTDYGYEEIEALLIENTMLMQSHIINNVLKPLIKEGKIKKLGHVSARNFKADTYKRGF